MKKLYFSALFVYSATFSLMAQKEQIKTAQAELNKGNVQETLTILNDIEYLITNAKDEDKSDYYFLKGKTYTALANKKIETPKNLSQAVACYNELILLEVDSGNLKYAVQARELIKELKSNLERSAIDDNNAQKFSDAAVKMYYLYEMDKKDTVNLYNSAINYFNAKQYDLALKNYETLKKLKYAGNGMEYYATNKKTSQEELFSSASNRDLGVKQGSHEKPRNVKAKSKKIEILKQIAYIYSEKGDVASAESNYKEIINVNPNDIEGYIDLAYIKLDKKKELADKMALLGTTPAEMKKYDELKIKKDEEVKVAVEYLEKALKLEPNNKDVSKLLLTLYRSLDLTDKYEALKAKG
ncbi:tetratricopeptide repeat protein [Flavobacterium sp. RSSA_27]|uniref:tetratricopeptide repeat protein n=1 Tax=Flavobacterium sp. RSSA_27 TaxID=3447667 RepID=UPI003F2F9C18